MTVSFKVMSIHDVVYGNACLIRAHSVYKAAEEAMGVVPGNKPTMFQMIPSL